MNQSTRTEVAPFGLRPAHLSIPRYRDETPNLHIIISTGSGTGEARKFFDNVVKATLNSIQLHERDYRLHTTESDNHITDFSRDIFLPRANEGIAQTILLLSGDGGIVDIVNVLLSSPQSDSYVKPVIGLFPLGTGNALANSIGLTHGSTRGLRSLLRGKPHSLPTFVATFSPGSEFLIDDGKGTAPLSTSENGFGIVYGAVVCSWALHASLVAESDSSEYRKYGAERFKMAAQELLAPSNSSASHAYKGKITLIREGQEGLENTLMLDRREHMYILATLVSNLEEKFTISPNSVPLDGQLRLVHFGALSAPEVMKIFGLAYQGGLHINYSGVHYDDIKGVRIDLEEQESRWRRICIDGKIVTVDEGGWVEIRKELRDVLDIIVDLED